ncbi:15785_t:CDS:2 [Racocetra fulgida]|uniref:15785_t:CDS:1 n=1 Tax=Racocetra fulgida TaxID=60492 RepID=A0A9N8ZE40_9GLOM|nr:15785_t:CDS:2 [Racocetra fulgida]
MIVHITQAYTLEVQLSFVSSCHVYVTDCNETVIRDAGHKYCDGNLWHWDEATEAQYCLHIYPLTKPGDNRYCRASKDACFKVDGDLILWGIYTCGDPSYPCKT